MKFFHFQVLKQSEKLREIKPRVGITFTDRFLREINQYLCQILILQVKLII